MRPGQRDGEALRQILGRRPPLHFVGICGKGMGAIAAALSREGWEVSGSDDATYPPMNTYLKELGISVSVFDSAAATGPRNGETLFVIGKRVDPGNPELDAITERSLTRASLPQLLAALLPPTAALAIVAGGVGKTTTTAMLAWILEFAGLSPDYFVGGMPRGFADPARWRGGNIAVLEGDEYASCFDDPTPKFLHFHPRILVVTNLFEDHPDMTVRLADAVTELAAGLPASGILIGTDADANLVAAKGALRCRVEKISQARLIVEQLDRDGSTFQLDGVSYRIPLCGAMNIQNAAMALLASRHLGVEPEAAAQGLAAFEGVAHRQEVVTLGRTRVVFDKATHPAAIAGLIEAQRQREPDRRILLMLQPRATGGRRWIYQRDLPAACSMADGVFLASPYEHRPPPDTAWASDPFDVESLARDIASKGVPVWRIRKPDDISQAFGEQIRPEEDVVVVSLPEQAHTMRSAIQKALAG